MRFSYRSLSVAIWGVVVLAMAVAPVLADCVSGTITSEYQASGPFIGLYKYCLTITWSTPQDISNVTLDCGFGNCPGAACAAAWYFDTPAGTSVGVPAPCIVEYAGEFNCDGNPSIGLMDPIIKWDALADTSATNCQPGTEGTAVLCFYSAAGPDPESSIPVVLLKNDTNVCSGMISGDCPSVCPVATETKTIGAVKWFYGDI